MELPISDNLANDDRPLLVVETVEDADYYYYTENDFPDAISVAHSVMKRLRSSVTADASCNPLLHLELEDFPIDWFEDNVQERVEEFLDAIRDNKTVTNVSVSGEFLKDMGALLQTNNFENGIVDSFDWMLFDVTGQLPELTTLVLQEVIDFDGYTLPVDILQRVLRKANKLETLQLRFVELAPPTTPSKEDDLDASLTSLHYRDDENSATNRTLLRAFRNHPSLKEVTLTQLRLQEGVGLNSLLRGLSTIPHLRTLKLHMSVHRQQERRHIRVEGPDDIDHTRAGSQLPSAALNSVAMVESLETLELSSL